MEGATAGNEKVNVNKVHYIHIHKDVIINISVFNILFLYTRQLGEGMTSD